MNLPLDPGGTRHASALPGPSLVQENLRSQRIREKPEKHVPQRWQRAGTTALHPSLALVAERLSLGVAPSSSFSASPVE